MGAAIALVVPDVSCGRCVGGGGVRLGNPRRGATMIMVPEERVGFVDRSARLP